MTRLWKSATLATLVSVTPLLSLSPASADTLNMPQQSESAPVVSVTLPGRGMTMTQVVDRFGEPQQKISEVGDPPIIRWIYPDFTVYFEYQYVINAVSHVTGPAPTVPEDLPDSTGGAAGNGEATPPRPDAMMPANNAKP